MSIKTAVTDLVKKPIINSCIVVHINSLKRHFVMKIYIQGDYN